MAQDHDDAKTGDLPETTGAAEHNAAGLLVDDDAEKADDSDGEFDVEFDVEADDGIETSDFEVEDPTMLLGEMRDHVLDAIKRTPVWKGLDKKGQLNLANEVEQASRTVIRKAVRIAAGMNLDAIEVTISKPTLTDKRQIEAKILCPYEVKTWAAMPEHGKRTLVFADAETLMNARAVAVMEDQPGLFGDGTERPQEKDKREAIEAEQREHEASIARAKQFRQLDDTATVGSEAAKLVGEMLPPKIKAAVDRGVAHRQAGGSCVVPKDLEGKPAEVGAWLKGWDTADASAGGHAVDDATGEVKAAAAEVDPETGERYLGGAKPPARAPRGHRSKRVAETAGA